MKILRLLTLTGALLGTTLQAAYVGYNASSKLLQDSIKVGLGVNFTVGAGGTFTWENGAVFAGDAAAFRTLIGAAPAGGSGTVTSVGLTVPTGFQVSGSPVTTAGTFGLTFASGYQGYTTAEAAKLAGIASGATANSTDAQLRDRSTHTGPQAISTITGLQGELDLKAVSSLLVANNASGVNTDGLIHWTQLIGVPADFADGTDDGGGGGTDDQTAVEVPNTPAGNIAATNVQAALNELDSEKETPAGAQAKADAKVVNGINNGATTTAPSEDAVFDALTLKATSAALLAVNGSGINNGGLVHWTQLMGVPAGIADGTDDGGGNVATDTIFDAKGDLVVGTGADTAAKLSAGTNGHVLTLDSAEVTGMKWAAPGAGSSQRNFAVVIAASDSVSTAGADYICDGTDDQIQIQAAIDAVSTAGGGTVFLREGHYYYDDAAILPKNYVTLKGESRNGTILVPSWTATRSAIGDGTNSGAFTSSTPLTQFEIRSLTLDCTNASATSYGPATKGIFIQYMRDCVIDDVSVLESYATAIGVDYLVNCKITNIYIRNHGRGMNPAGSGVGGNGVGIGTGGFAVETCYIANVQVLVDNGLGNNGIMFESQNTETNSQHMVVDGFQVTGSYTGLRVSGVESVSFSDGRVISPQQDGIYISDGINGNGKASNKLKFSDIVVTGAGRNALRFDYTGSDMEFNSCTFSGSTSTNVLFNTSMTDIRFVGGQSNGSAVHGVSMSSECTAVRFTGFNVFGNTTDGYNIGACIDLAINGGSAWDNGDDGIDLDGVVGPVAIRGVSAYLNDDQGIQATNVNRTLIADCQLYLNADSGITFNNTSGTARNLVDGNVIQNNGTNTGLTYRSAIVLLGSGALTYSTFQNNITGDSQGSPTQRYGLVPQSSNRSFVVFQNNDFRNNLTGAVSTGTAGSNEIRKNNLGLNPEGGASITVGASPYTYTAGTSPEMVYIHGGTVSDVAKGGATIATATGISVMLDSNQSVTVTYSSAPTMRKDRL